MHLLCFYKITSERRHILISPMRCALILHQPSTSQSAVTVEARAKAPTWSSPAWATASPAPSRHAIPCWWPPTSPTTSPPPPAAVPSAEMRRWVKDRFLFHSSLLGAQVLLVTLSAPSPPPGQSAAGLPQRSSPRHDRDPDSQGVPLRHVPQVPLLTCPPTESSHG